MRKQETGQKSMDGTILSNSTAKNADLRQAENSERELSQ